MLSLRIGTPKEQNSKKSRKIQQKKRKDCLVPQRKTHHETLRKPQEFTVPRLVLGIRIPGLAVHTF